MENKSFLFESVQYLKSLVLGPIISYKIFYPINNIYCKWNYNRVFVSEIGLEMKDFVGSIVVALILINTN